VKGCFRFGTFIFWISPNLAKYTYGLLPLWPTSSNFLKTNRTKMMNFCYKIHWKKHVVYIKNNNFGEYFFSYDKKRWCFWEIFPPFFEKKSREKFLDLNLVSSSAIAPLRWLRYSKESWKKFTVHSTVLQIIAISLWGSLLGKLLKQCAKEKPWLCTIYTMFLIIIWYHNHHELLSEKHILHL
jgi:hypothetical protein